MSAEKVLIVDCGRGPQLALKRVTVQDLLPLHREGASDEEIQRWFPSLSVDEIVVLRNYIADNLPEVLQFERDAKAYHDRMRQSQPSWTRATDDLPLADRKALLKQKLANWMSETTCGDDSAR